MTNIETTRAKRTKLTKRIKLILVVAIALVFAASGGIIQAKFSARDPGVRGEPFGAGGHIANLSESQVAFFVAGQAAFLEEEDIGDGLGPRFNFNSCVGCHSQPAPGGSSPELNPQFARIKEFPGNALPFFITDKGPIREARFQFGPDGARDGGVHNLFVVRGDDISNCQIEQPDFLTEFKRNNLIFRIPTPVFGAGLIEQIPDAAIVANLGANADKKAALGIAGRPHRISGSPNNNGNDGTIARFGWKAQNKSLLLFSGEAYNVEMGITNELFQTERDETQECQVATVPNNVTNTDGETALATLSDIEKFAFFMRFLAPPEQSPGTSGVSGSVSIGNGGHVFEAIGCAYCHTPTLRTGNATVAALANKDVKLFSDLALHQMGKDLADGIIQGEAQGDEFRTAPLWGLGQRIFFLHDGRTTDLVEAIQAHGSGASEAKKVIKNFNALDESAKQDLLNFLRSL
jgi:CxxC motif-containing protein (DUF1111 family)